jgi:hypothetical protein
MLPWRYRVPRTARHDGSGHRNDYDLENQSCGRDRSSGRRSTTVLTGAGISEPSLLNTRCNILSVATTSWPRSVLKRSAHLRTGRRRTLNGYLELIRSTSLTRSCVPHRSSRNHLSTNFPFASLRMEPRAASFAVESALRRPAASGAACRSTIVKLVGIIWATRSLSRCSLPFRAMARADFLRYVWNACHDGPDSFCCPCGRPCG